jgi:CRISPR system Cascade subunit CasE
MYLSRLILNPRSRQVRSELLNPYEMHRTLMRAFPDDLTGERVLFRVDVDRQTGTPTVLVQSALEPCWGFLSEGAGYLLDGEDCNPDWRCFEPQVAPGQLLQFRLRANPTMKKRVGRDHADLGKGVRVGLYTEEEQRAWLDRKGSDGGFGVVSCHVIPEGKSDHMKGKAADRDRMPLLSVRFDGILQVADPEALLATLRSGIGSAKAFGFGLLSLAKA